jgi:hypothetical protein
MLMKLRVSLFAGLGRAKGDGSKSIRIIAINGPIRQ